MKSKITKCVTSLNVLLFLLICVFAFASDTKLFSIAGRTFSLSFYLSVIALPLFYCSYFFIYKKRSIDYLIKNIAVLFSVLFVSSLAMGYILYPNYSGLFSTSPTKTVLINAIKYLYDLAVIPYFVFWLSYLNKKLFKRCFYIFLVAWIVIGAFQITAYRINNPTLWSIYDKIDILKIIGGTSTMMNRVRLNYGSFRFFGIGSEPAANCVLISALVLPFLAREIIKDSRLIKRIINSALFLISLSFALLTKSASVYVGLAIDFLFLCFYLFGSTQIPKKWKIISGAGILAVGIVSLIVPATREIIVNRFLLKLVDTSDYSTQYRYSTIWNDFLILLKYPLFGVGDGNQGYFYSKHILGTWMARGIESQQAIKGEFGLLNGGAAIPSLFSGFGLMGIAAIIVAARKTLRTGTRKSHFAIIKPYYVLTVTVVSALSFATIGIHRNYALLLVLSSYNIFAFGDIPLKELSGYLTAGVPKGVIEVTKYSI